MKNALSPQAKNFLANWTVGRRHWLTGKGLSLVDGGYTDRLQMLARLRVDALQMKEMEGEYGYRGATLLRLLDTEREGVLAFLDAVIEHGSGLHNLVGNIPFRPAPNP